MKPLVYHREVSGSGVDNTLVRAWALEERVKY